MGINPRILSEVKMLLIIQDLNFVFSHIDSFLLIIYIKLIITLR
jgi:hypothetical protein